MHPSSKSIQNTYVALTLFNTLAASFIWGINTIFLLDAGLTNLEAFAANAFFTAGEVLFEVPTGIVADTWGRRASYLLGAVTLGISTLLYLFAWHAHAPFIWWAMTSLLLGLGFTFFSGATEAWLVDALDYTGFKGNLTSVFAKGQIAQGIAMLSGSVAGGLVAQATNLGVPYILRTVFLGLTFGVAFFRMKDLGFKPTNEKHALRQMRNIFKTSIDLGLRNAPVRWVMLAAPFTMGVSFYAFYAMQPFLLKLWGDPHAYFIAGLAAAIIAGAQIIGGMTARYVSKIFEKRTTVMISAVILGSVLLLSLGFTSNFWVAIFILIIWGLLSSAVVPVRQTYLNGLIPSSSRATILSFDSMIGSSGGVFIQPVLGKVADVYSYSLAYIEGAAFQILALPFLIFARMENPKSDEIK